MTTVAELRKQKEAIEAKIAEALKSERSDAIKKVKELVATFELTEKDVFGAAKRGRKPNTAGASKAAPKYRDPVTGATWAGRGKPPKWIQGKDRAKFLIG